MRKSGKHSLPKGQQGVGLIEVLVAVLILAVGLLGLASLQAQSLRFNNESYLRTQAAVLAMDMSDRMRANRQLIRQNPGLYAFEKDDDPYPNATTTGCETSNCSAQQLVEYDFRQWRSRVEEVLPGGRAGISHDSSNPGTFTISVGYNLSFGQEGSGAEEQVFEVRVRI